MERNRTVVSSMDKKVTNLLARKSIPRQTKKVIIAAY